MNTYTHFATCFKEPRGDHGLEGYQLHDVYHCRLINTNDGKTIVGIIPDVQYNPLYEETCTFAIFRKYFSLSARRTIVEHS